MRAEIDKGVRALFPDLEPCGTNERGGRLFAIRDVTKALETDEGELIKLAQALEAGKVII